MSKKGIFNPFKPVEEKPKNPLDNEQYDTEQGPPSVGNIRLDGDSFILELQETVLEDVPKRLGALLTSLIEEHGPSLLRNGVNLIPKGTTYKTEKTDAVLNTPAGRLHVHVGETTEEDDLEVLAFRRIAYAINCLNIPEKLKEYQVKVIARV